MTVRSTTVRGFGAVSPGVRWHAPAAGRPAAVHSRRRIMGPKHRPCAISPIDLAPGFQRGLCDLAGNTALARTVVRQDDGSVKIRWNDNHESTFHGRWLFEHCPLRTSGPGGQKAAAPAGRSRTLRSAAAEHGAGGRQRVVVEWGCGDKSTFEAAWLRAHCYSKRACQTRARLRDPLPHALGASSLIPSVSYRDIMAADQGLLEWTINLERHGLCLVRDTPCVDGEVVRLASRLAPVMPTLYGDYWNVRVEPDAVNVAYSKSCTHT